MDTTKKLVRRLLSDNEIALVPYNPNPRKDLKILFEHFEKLNKNDLYKALIENHDECEIEQLEFALNTVKHYKGWFDWFDTSLEFNIYQKIKPWLGVQAKKRFRIHFYKHYAEALLKGEIDELDEELINLILVKDIKLYMKIAKKLHIPDAVKQIYNRYPNEIFNWLNDCSDIYNELHKLNQPIFILNNMNGKLNISDGTLKYIVEKIEPNIELFLSIKNKIGFKKLWKFSKHRFNPSFYVDLIESFDDLIFVINTPNMSLNSLELILSKTKEKFPLIYDNLNSLLFVKKEFSNK